MTDLERFDAIADGIVVIRQNHNGSWSVRHVEDPVWVPESSHLRPTLREAVDAAMEGK